LFPTQKKLFSFKYRYAWVFEVFKDFNTHIFVLYFQHYGRLELERFFEPGQAVPRNFAEVG